MNQVSLPALRTSDLESGMRILQVGVLVGGKNPGDEMLYLLDAEIAGEVRNIGGSLMIAVLEKKYDLFPIDWMVEKVVGGSENPADYLMRAFLDTAANRRYLADMVVRNDLRGFYELTQINVVTAQHKLRMMRAEIAEREERAFNHKNRVFA